MKLRFLNVKKVFLLGTLTFFCFSGQEVFGQTVFKTRVNASTDDAEEKPKGTAGDLTSSDLEFVMDKTSNQIIGLRFTNVTLPKNALITNAYVQFAVDEVTNIDPCKLTIKIQDNLNPGTFTADVATISGRSYVKDSVLWNPTAAWTVDGEAGFDQRTPNISRLLSTIINQSGWNAGNSIVLAFTGEGARVAQAYDRDPAKAPELVIEYILPISSSYSILTSSDDAEEKPTGTAGDLTSSDLEFVMDKTSKQTLGLRFDKLGIPKNAVIKQAHIQFTVDEVTNVDPCKLTIKVEDGINPGTFTSASGTISTRKTFKDSVLWNPTAAWTVDGDAGLDQRTPDLSNLVQKVVSQDGWQQGNALVFVVDGEGSRVAQAYDRDPSKAPRLVVDYFVPTQNTFAILGSTDDAEEKPKGTAGDLTSSDLELTMDKTSQQVIGLRFDKITIPQGMELQHAYIQFAVDEVTNIDPCKLVIQIEDTDNAATFTSAVGTISNRKLVLDSVIWNPTAAWTVDGEAGLEQRTPNLAGLINKVITSPSWKSGNALSLVINGVGARVAQAYDRDPSKAPKLVVEYLSGTNQSQPKPKAEIGTFPINRNSQWKYADDGISLDQENWKDVVYHKDTNWVFGNGKLGYGQAGLGTDLKFGTDAQNKNVTTYLRRNFITKGSSKYDSLVLYLLADDGASIYINGQRVYTENLPDSFTSSTLATSEKIDTKYNRIVIPNSLIDNDTNVLAVELHQAAINGTDLVFDLQLIGKLPYPSIASFPIKKGDNWLFHDQGKDLGTAWTALNYEDKGWANGPALLGYTDPVSTIVSFGDDNNNKYITNYFRKRFDVKDISVLSDTLKLSLMKDDGAVVYINGKEVVRANMPEGTITYGTFAKSSATEGIYESYLISKASLVNGENMISVEVHQNEVNSSDLTFDLELTNMPKAYNSAEFCKNNPEHIGCFQSVGSLTKGQSLVIPNDHKMQMLAQSGMPYTKGGGTITTNFDFTGFIPEGMKSSEKGHIALNHELTNGAVSMFDVHLDKLNLLWVVDSSQSIDFTKVQGTGRNCSGGVTPWGTVITAEEVRGNTDVNSDGYVDQGWLVEIDPRTNKVVDYGQGEAKLWAMGNMSHENVVLKNDSLTAYYGEDASNAHVYKFVASKKGNLSEGTLYALKLDAQMVNHEPVVSKGKWIKVPNTTKEERNKVYVNATALGATLFQGVEDVEINPVNGDIYFTAKGNSRTYKFTEKNDSIIENFETFVGGTDYLISTANGVVSEPWGTGNDNLTFDDMGNLWVLQDGTKDHIWVIRPGHTQLNPQVEIFATTPDGSEPTGMTFSPDYKYMFISMQNPSSSNSTKLVDASGKELIFNTSTMLVIARNRNLGCAPKTATIKYTTCDSFTWNGTTYTEGGKYTYKTLTKNGCDSIVELELVVNKKVTSTETKTACVPYVWNGQDIKESGTFTWTGKSHNGCDSVVTLNFTSKSEEECKLGLASLESTTVHLYPNPFTDKLKIDFSESSFGTGVINVYDVQGKLVLTKEIETSAKMIELGETLVPGTYQMQIKRGEISATYSIVKN
jgi:secreted PhoX family phosphatase